MNSLIYSCFELSEEREFASTLTLRQGAVLFLEGTEPFVFSRGHGSQGAPLDEEAQRRALLEGGRLQRQARAKARMPGAMRRWEMAE